MNLTLLKNLMGGDERLVTHFVSIFKAQVPTQVSSLLQLSEDGNWEELSNAFHSLKTQFTYVGLDEFAEKMSVLENLVDCGKTSTIMLQIQEFTSSFEESLQSDFS